MEPCLYSLLAVAMATVPPAPPRYHFTILPSFEQEAGGWPYAINNSGQITGEGPVPHGFTLFPRAYRLTNRTQELLPVYEGDVESHGFAINTAGDIAGSTGYNPSHAMLWTADGTPVDLGFLGQGVGAHAYGLNDHGEVVGLAWLDRNGTHHAFHWRDGVLTDLGTLGGQRSFARDVNNSGLVVGSAENAAGYTRAFVWTVEKGMTDIGLFSDDPMSFPNPFDVDEAGRIVGSTSNDGTIKAILWENGVTTELGTLGMESQAHAINERGEIVGMSYPPMQSNHAVIWLNGVLFDLNDYVNFPPGPNTWVMHDAFDNNDAGQIVGYSQTNSADWYPTLLTPIRIRLSDPSPGRAGAMNELRITEGRPNARIDILYGAADGITALPGCGGGLVLISQPVAAGSVRTDSNGDAVFEGFVPAAAGGRRVLIQALDRSACEVSDVIVHRFLR